MLRKASRAALTTLPLASAILTFILSYPLPPLLKAYVRLGAKAFGSSGNHNKALILIRTAINILSQATGETTELAIGYLILGDILRDMGNFAEAEKAFRDAESIFRRNDDFSQAGDALNRLAGIFFRKGDFEGSLKSLIEAVNYANNENDSRKLAYLYGNIGLSNLSIGHLRSEDFPPNRIIAKNMKITAAISNPT